MNLAAWIDNAFLLGIGIGISFIGFCVSACVIAYTLDVHDARRTQKAGRRSKLSPIEDMTTWKRQRRIDEAAEWQAQFNALLPTQQRPAAHHGTPGPKYLAVVRGHRKPTPAGPPHQCSCGWISYGSSDAEQHRRDHAWEVRNLHSLPADYVPLYRQART